MNQSKLCVIVTQIYYNEIRKYKIKLKRNQKKLNQTKQNKILENEIK